MSQAARSPQGMAQAEPVGITVTASDLNPVVQIVTWLLFALASLVLCFRILTNFFLKAHRKPGIEDVLIFAAYSFSVGESACMLLPGSSIFGRTNTQISSNQLKTGVKIGYARDLLLVVSLGLAKLSVSAGILALSPDRTHRRMNFMLSAVIGLWTLTSFFATAFQCGSHGPWNQESSYCFNQLAFYQYVGVTNILTDVALIALPVAIIWPLRMSWANLATAMAVFIFRILVIAATIAQLIYLPKLFNENWTLHALPYFLSTQFVQFASISAACIVYFLPFARSLQSGLPWATGTAFASSYALSKITKDTKEGSASTANDNNHSWNAENRNYIKITTENKILSRSRSQEPDPQPTTIAEVYRPAW